MRRLILWFAALLLFLPSACAEEQRLAPAYPVPQYVQWLLDVARGELGYTEDYLSRLFHENANCSFRQYLHRLRMDRAKRELLSGVKTIQQIAGECGYSNSKFFSTVFLKCEGLSPSEYRNLYGTQHQNAD